MNQGDPPKTLFVIIPVYGRLDATRLAVESLERAVKQRLIIVIVDDGPLREHLRDQSLRRNNNVYIIEGTGSLFWGGGINRGLDYLESCNTTLDSDLVAFMNNDVVLEDQAFGELEGALENLPDSLVHPKLVDNNGRNVVAGSVVKFWFPFLTSKANPADGQIARVDLASARFLMGKYQTIKKIGKISNRLPHYQGDNDFTLRAKRYGYNCYIIGAATITVDESETGNKSKTSQSLRMFIKSFFDIRSPNAIKYRYRFVSNHFGIFSSVFITAGMVIKIFCYYILLRIQRLMSTSVRFGKG